MQPSELPEQDSVPEIHEDIQKQLLKAYEPSLRFSAYEQFFPMNVDDYIKKCKVKTPNFGPDKILNQQETLQELLQKSKNGCPNTYLNYISPEPGLWGLVANFLSRYKNFVTIFYMVATTLLILFGQDIALHFDTNLSWRFVIALLILWLYPFYLVNGQAFLAVFLNIIGILLLGTYMGLWVGIFGIAIILGFSIAHVFDYIYTYGPLSMSFETFNSTRLKGTEIGINRLLLTIRIAGYVVLIILTILLVFVWGAISGSPRNFLDFVRLLFGLSLITGCISLLWSYAGKVVLSIATSVIVIFMGAAWLDIYSGANQLGFDMTTLIILATVLVRFFLQPLPVVKTELGKITHYQFEVLNGRKMITVLLTLLLWIATTVWFLAANATSSLSIFFPAILIAGINLTISSLLVGGQLPAMFMDITSSHNRLTVTKAVDQYHEAVNKRSLKEKFCYYGRVWSGTASSKTKSWLVLQYHYFYAFNDYRTACNGFNNHEGDWEMVAVFIKNYSLEQYATELENNKALPIPFGVGYSQHHNGEFRLWKDVRKGRSQTGEQSYHPVVYVALGSHANYPEPAELLLQQQTTGIAADAITLFDNLQKRAFEPSGQVQFGDTQLLLSAVVKEELAPVNRNWASRGEIHREISVIWDDITDVALYSPKSGLPLEHACGDGISVGNVQIEVESREQDARYASRVPIQTQQTRQRNTFPNVDAEQLEWDCRLLMQQEHYWLDYRGLWGHKTILKDESGPMGPKFKRIESSKQQRELITRITGGEAIPSAEGKEYRPRWGTPLRWMHILLWEIASNENISAIRRAKALDAMLELARLEQTK